MALLPSTVDIRITGNCDLRSLPCFGPCHELGRANMSLLLEAVNRFPEHGVQCVVVTGGEPCLVPELPTLLRTLRSLGLRTVLSTNGILFSQRMDELAQYIDWIGLPLDADSETVNAVMRVGNPSHFRIVVSLLPKIRRDFPHMRIKLETVVCALNKDSVATIPHILPPDHMPDVWALRQVVYSSYGAANRQVLELDNDAFETVVAQAQIVAMKHRIPLSCSLREDRDSKYLFIEPNGDASVVSGGCELVIGNLFRDFGGVVSAWQHYIDKAKFRIHSFQRYPDFWLPVQQGNVGGD